MNKPFISPKLTTHEDVLEALVDEVSLPMTIMVRIHERYHSISEHFDRDASNIKQYEPNVFPQGSVNLGTANKPVGKKDEIDVDMVVNLLRLNKSKLSQAELKALIHTEVQLYARQHNMMEPIDGKRCSTLNYRDHQHGEDRFHVDILPSIPDVEGYSGVLTARGLDPSTFYIDGAIAITCKRHPNYRIRSQDWPVSNPKGYAKWFESSQQAALIERRAHLVASGAYASVEEIPLFRVNTPLQKVVKILKRDRDVTMAGDKDKPISIILTTLAAHAYNGENDIVSALKIVLRNMENYIETRNGKYYIPNPVNPAENFADKWEVEPKKAQKFFAWLRQAQKTYAVFLSSNIQDAPDTLSHSLSDKVLGAIKSRLPSTVPPIASRIKTEGDRMAQSPKVHKPWCRR